MAFDRAVIALGEDAVQVSFGSRLQPNCAARLAKAGEGVGGGDNGAPGGDHLALPFTEHLLERLAL